MRNFLCCARGAAAVETAIFAPLFVLFMVGITDLGAGMFVRMAANAAAQAGAAYAAFHTHDPATCATLTTACQSNMRAAMNNAASNSSFCTSSVCPMPSIVEPCADGAPNSKCISVTVNYPYTPILRDAVYTWGKTQTYSSTVIIRIR